MKLEFGVNPNCSESVMRFNTSKLTDDQEEKLYETLVGFVKEYNYSTDVFKEKIFDVKCIVVDGDAPYKASEKLRASSQNLSFLN